jgi:hypothetical protein
MLPQPALSLSNGAKTPLRRAQTLLPGPARRAVPQGMSNVLQTTMLSPRPKRSGVEGSQPAQLGYAALMPSGDSSTPLRSGRNAMIAVTLPMP